MSLSRVWVIHPKLNPELALKGELSRFRRAEIKIVSSVNALAEELESSERMILLADPNNFVKVQELYVDRILAARILPQKIDRSALILYIDAVLHDSHLQQDLEALELNAWTGVKSEQLDEPSLEFLGKTVLRISSCRDLVAVEEELLESCKKIGPVLEILIAHNPPYLSSRVLGNYQLAVPVNFNESLKAHVYARFDEAPSPKEIEAVGEFIINLSDIIALSVERHNILSEAEQTRLIWEASFNAVEDPVVILNENFELVRANKAYGLLLKSPVAKLLGKRIPTEFLEMASLEQQSSEWDSHYQGHWYRVFFDPFVNPFGEGRSVVRIRDIKEEKAITEKILAREQVAELGILVGSIAHEINNPIGGIIALCQVLIKDVTADSPIHKDLVNIIGAGERCKKIVQTMLSLVRKSSDHHSIFHLGDSIGAALELVSAEVHRINVKINAEGLSLGKDYLGNRNRIMQVGFHLLQGALQALEARQEKGSRELQVRLKKEDQLLSLTLADNGSRQIHEHVLKNSVSYAVAQLLLEEHSAHLRFEQDGPWNLQQVDFPLFD